MTEYSKMDTTNVSLFVLSERLPLLFKVSLFSPIKEKAPLSFAFDLIAWSLLDFDLVDLSAGIPLDPDTFLETSWIHSQKREEVISQD